MLVVAALGGNALLRRGQAPDAETQRENTRTAVDALCEIIAEHDVVVTHGNGPQIGLLALQSEALREVGRTPLDVLGAESEGMIGYLIENELSPRLPGREVAALLTRVEINPNDPAFARPTKPIGPLYSEDHARKLSVERGWAIVRDGAGFRRAVASPDPIRVLELPTIRRLVRAGVVVICAGGGGIPVAIAPDGSQRGVEAVVDKDYAAALLARELGAKALLLLTDQPGIYRDWPEPASQLIRTISPDELRALSLEPGTMAPKAEAACRFVAQTGGRAAIGALGDAARILRGDAGTAVVC